MEVFPGTLLVHSGNTCSWTQVPCPPEAFPPGKEAWCSQYAVYTANCTKITGAWQKFMYNPKHIINQHKQIKFHERNTSTHKSTMTNHNQPTPQKVRLTTTYNHHHKTSTGLDCKPNKPDLQKINSTAATRETPTIPTAPNLSYTDN